MSQNDRIFYILQKLKNDQPITLQSIIDRYETSRSSAARDIEFIKDRLGLEVHFVKSPVPSYKITHESGELLRSIIEHHELMFLSLIWGFSRNHFLVPAELDNLKRSLKLTLSDYALKTAERVSYVMTQSSEIDFGLCQDILTCLHENRQLLISYKNLDGVDSKRYVEPVHFRNRDGQWYLLAFCCHAEDLRIFHAGRISDWEVSERGCSHEIAPEAERAFLDNGFGIMSAAGDAVLVKLKFTGVGQTVIRGRLWHEDQVVDEGGEGTLVSFPVHGFEELLGIVLGFGPDAEVLEPPAFRKMWLDRIRKMFEIFCQSLTI